MDDLKKIKELRAKIDSIDDKILELLNQRARFVIEIGKTKLQGKRDFYAPEREKEIYHRLTQNNQGPFPNQALKNVFREIMSIALFGKTIEGGLSRAKGHIHPSGMHAIFWPFRRVCP